jgi:hypothetical protein
MTPTAKQPAQSSAAKTIINAEISFRRRVTNKANQRISTRPVGRVGGQWPEVPAQSDQLK